MRTTDKKTSDAVRHLKCLPCASFSLSHADRTPAATASPVSSTRIDLSARECYYRLGRMSQKRSLI